jgi:hypothetical protein
MWRNTNWFLNVELEKNQIKSNVKWKENVKLLRKRAVKQNDKENKKQKKIIWDQISLNFYQAFICKKNYKQKIYKTW